MDDKLAHIGCLSRADSSLKGSLAWRIESSSKLVAARELVFLHHLHTVYIHPPTPHWWSAEASEVRQLASVTRGVQRGECCSHGGRRVADERIEPTTTMRGSEHYYRRPKWCRLGNPLRCQFFYPAPGRRHWLPREKSAGPTFEAPMSPKKISSMHRADKLSHQANPI